MNKDFGDLHGGVPRLCKLWNVAYREWVGSTPPRRPGDDEAAAPRNRNDQACRCNEFHPLAAKRLCRSHAPCLAFADYVSNIKGVRESGGGAGTLLIWTGWPIGAP